MHVYVLFMFYVDAHMLHTKRIEAWKLKLCSTNILSIALFYCYMIFCSCFALWHVYKLYVNILYKLHQVPM